MTDLKKKRIKAVMKYTWPFYIIAVVIVVFAMNFIFGLTHKIPGYKTLTFFISGKVTNRDKLEKDLKEKFADKDLRYISCIDVEYSHSMFNSKLSITGYTSADILIIPKEKLDSVNVDAFGLELEEGLIESYYSSCELYTQNHIKYGVKIDEDKVKDYMDLSTTDCYMILNGKSQNLGEYSIKNTSKDHNMALTLVKDWGKNV